jgi:hypothetical protein
MDKDWYFAVKVMDVAEPINVDPNTKELSILTSDWNQKLDPILHISVNNQTQAVNEEVQLYADGSFDPDGGEVVSYEWDLNNDGIFEYEGQTVTHAWDTPGEYPVQCRITDDEGSSSVLDAPIIIYIHEKEWFDAYEPGPVLTWGGWGSDRATCMTTDDTGNTYVASNFERLVDFDPGPGHQESQSCDNENIALSKFNGNGYLEWVRTWRNNDYISIFGISHDSLGNVYITGKFALSLDFDPGPEEYILQANLETAQPNHDAFLIKLSPEGELVWAVKWGEKGYDTGQSIAVDNLDNVYVTGCYGSTVDFDPGPGENYESAYNDYSISHDIFLSKFNSDGIHQWTGTWGTPKGTYDRGRLDNCGYFVLLDDYRNIYLAGSFSELINFNTSAGPVTFTSAGFDSSFLLKLTEDGEISWARAWGTECETSNSKAYIKDIFISDNSTLYASIYWDGNLSLDLSLDNSPEILGDTRSFGILKFNLDGNLLDKYVWQGFGQLKVLSAGNDGSLNLAGDFYGRINLSTTSGPFQTLSYDHLNDLIFGQVNPDGLFTWVKTIQSPGSQNIYSVSQFSPDRFGILGCFSNTVDFDPGPGIEERTSNGGNDIFLLQMDQYGNLLGGGS